MKVGAILGQVEFDLSYMLSLILLFTGLILLLSGFLLKKRKESHFVLIIGWVLFGSFWLMQIPHFLAIGDTFNAMFCLLGFLLFLFFAYHEILNLKWNENLYSLNYIAGIVAAGGLFYYLIEKIEPLAQALIYIVSVKSVWVLNLFGFEAGVGSFGYPPPFYELSLDIIGSRISIILACTGIQSIAIFIGILLVTRSNRKLWEKSSKQILKEKPSKGFEKSYIKLQLLDWKKARVKKVLNMTDKSRFIRAFMYTVPIIYILNIFRNSIIIWGVENEVLGPWYVTYDIAHNYLSKILSLVVLIIMVFIVFELLPECREGIIGLVDLQYRSQKGLVTNGFVNLDKVDRLKQRENRTQKKGKITKSGKDNKGQKMRD